MEKIFYATLVLTACTLAALGQGDDKLQISVGYSHGIVNNFTGDTYRESSTVGGQSFIDTLGSKKSDQLNGLDLSGTYRLSDHFAAKVSLGWFSGSASSGVVPGGSYVRGSVQNPTYFLIVPGFTNRVKQSYYTFMAGVEYKDFKSAHKLNPFGQVLIGVGFENASTNLASSSTHALIYQAETLKINATAFSIDAGAGLDLKLNKNFDIRIIQVDFMPTLPGKKLIQKTGDARGPFPGTPFPTEQLYVDQDVSSVNKFQANLRFGAGVVFTPNL
ncbi:MAG: outer membrane beta-barrel protein [Mucilaginibacter sp.]